MKALDPTGSMRIERALSAKVASVKQQALFDPSWSVSLACIRIRNFL